MTKARRHPDHCAFSAGRLPLPPDHRIWGTVMRRLATDGRIVRDGDYVMDRRGRLETLWRKA